VSAAEQGVESICAGTETLGSRAASLCASPLADAPAAESSRLPSLSAKQLWKLKQLSLMTMAASTSRLSYPGVVSGLDLATTGEVESLVISCVDAGLLDAKMNQVRTLMFVASVNVFRRVPMDCCCPVECAARWNDRRKPRLWRCSRCAGAIWQSAMLQTP
jgi:hypothetical protein